MALKIINRRVVETSV